MMTNDVRAVRRFSVAGDVARGFGALVALGGLLVGVPLVLLRWGHWPITGLPSWDQVTDLPTTLLSDSTVLGIFTVALWLVWAVFTVSVLAEAAAQVQGRRRGALPGWSPVQRLAGHLVATVMVAFGSFASLSAATAAVAPSPAQATTASMGRGAHAAIARVDDLPAEARSPRPFRGVPAADVLVASPAGSAGRVAAPSPPPPSAAPATVIVVSRGDSPWKLAEDHLGDGMRWRELWEFNRARPQPDGGVWANPDDAIRPGWQLAIPGTGGAPGAVAATGVVVPAAGTTLPPQDVVVEQGDNFWEMAEDQLTDAWGRQPADSEVAGYWHDSLDANAARLQPPRDPDDIYPGEVFALPATPADPLAPPPPAPPPTPTPAPSTSGNGAAAGSSGGSGAPDAGAPQAGTGTGQEAPSAAAPTPAPAPAPATTAPPATTATTAASDGAAAPEATTPETTEAPATTARTAAPEAEAAAPEVTEPETTEAPATTARTAAPEAEAAAPEVTEPETTEAPATTATTAAPDEGAAAPEAATPETTAAPATTATTAAPDEGAAPAPSPEVSTESAPSGDEQRAQVSTPVRAAPAPEVTQPAAPATSVTTPTTAASEAPRQPTPTTAAAPTTEAPAQSPATTTPPATTAPPASATPGTTAPPATGADTPETTAAPAGDAAGPANDDNDDNDDEVGDKGNRLPIGIIGGGLALAGILLLLDRRRRAQFRHRRVGRRVLMPGDDLAAVERALRAGTDTKAARLVDAALRAAAAGAGVGGPPELRWVEATSDHVTLVVAPPAPAPPGFTDDGEGRWRTAGSVKDLAAIGAAASSLAPALVPVGVTDDGTEVLIDLESSGVLSVSGADEQVEPFLRSMALAAATAPWTEQPRVLLVGLSGELTALPWVESAGTLGVALVDAENRAAEAVSALRGLQCQTTAQARAAGSTPDAWEPLVVVSARAPHDERYRVAALAARPGHAVAVVCPPGETVHGRKIEIDEDGWATLADCDVRIRARQLAEDDTRAVVELLDVAGDRDGIPATQADEPEVRTPAPLDVAGIDDEAFGAGATPRVAPEEPRPTRVVGGALADAALDGHRSVRGPAPGPGPEGPPPGGGQTQPTPSTDRDEGDDIAARDAAAAVMAGPPSPAGGTAADARGSHEPIARGSHEPIARGSHEPIARAEGEPEAHDDGDGRPDSHDGDTHAHAHDDRDDVDDVLVFEGERPSRLADLLEDVDVLVKVLGDVEAVRLTPEGQERLVPGRQKALEAMTYLALREVPVDREDLEIVLFPTGANATKTFHNTVAAARRCLGDELFPAPSGGRYELAEGVVTDYGLFHELVAFAEEIEDAERAADVLSEALTLVGGEPFVGAGRGYAWVAPHRGMIVAQVVDVAEEVAEIRLATGEWRDAEWAARQGLRAFPCDERMYRLLMRAAHAAGNIPGVHRVFRELCDTVADPDDGAEPEDTIHPETLALLDTLTGGNGRNQVSA